MYLVTQLWYPPGRASEVGKIYLEAMKKYPLDKTISKPIIQGAFKQIKEGMYGFSVSFIKEGKTKEAMTLGTQRLLMMAEAIENMKYDMSVYFDLVEAMPFVGLKAPE